MLDKFSFRMDNMFDCAMFCPIYKTVCLICQTVCPKCWTIGQTWICSPLLMRKNLTSTKNMSTNFLLSDRISFLPDPPGPTVPIFCSPGSLPLITMCCNQVTIVSTFLDPWFGPLSYDFSHVSSFCCVCCCCGGDGIGDAELKKLYFVNPEALGIQILRKKNTKLQPLKIFIKMRKSQTW